MIPGRAGGWTSRGWAPGGGRGGARPVAEAGGPGHLFRPSPLGLRPRTAGDRAVFTAILLLALAGAAFAAFAPLPHLTFRSSDDSYYYLGVARNVVLGHGFTFDRIHATNGFHPLWMACLLPVVALAGGGVEPSLRLAFVLVALVGAATLWLAYVCLASHAGRGAGLLGLAALTAPPFLNPIVCGLETGLVLLLLFLFLWAVPRFGLLALAAGRRRNAALGLLLALLVLARLDTAFVALAVLAALPIRWLARAEGDVSLATLVTKLVQVGAVFGLTIAPYFAWNALAFGHLVPISGALKTSFPEITFTPRRLGTYHARYGQGLLLVGTIGVLASSLRRRRALNRESGARPEGGPLSHPVVPVLWAGCALHLLNTVLFMDFGVHWWHFASYVPLALLATGGAAVWVLGPATRPGRALAALAAAVLALSALGHVADSRHRGEQHEQWLGGALWARSNLPPDAILGMTDCGLVGYLSQRRTVNLDGVINGFPYQEALHRRELRRFLAASGMTHVVAHAVRYHRGAYFLWLPARLHREDGGAIIGLESAEVYRSPRPFRGTDFVIWELRRLPVFDDAASPQAQSYLPPF